MVKDTDAFRTIGELSDEIGVAQHILRYWETRFAQLRPLKRAGNRRYYRPDDVALVRKINRLLNEDGLTIKGVQKVLASKRSALDPDSTTGKEDIARELKTLRGNLAAALPPRTD